MDDVDIVPFALVGLLAILADQLIHNAFLNAETNEC